MRADDDSAPLVEDRSSRRPVAPAPGFESVPSLVSGIRDRTAEQLGAGGMGEVALVDDDRIGRRVALKKLRTEVRGDASLQHRFARVPVVRSYAPASNDHLLGLTAGEGAPAYGVEGIAFRVLSAAPAVGVPLHRCRQATGYHFLSNDPACEGTVAEGGIGFAHGAEVPGTLPLYRCHGKWQAPLHGHPGRVRTRGTRGGRDPGLRHRAAAVDVST